MPVTAAIIGALNTQGTRFRGFVSSLVYVLGLAVTYSMLAVVAACREKFLDSFKRSYRIDRSFFCSSVPCSLFLR
jgi:cytochrome c biogenesis protein CcdA